MHKIQKLLLILSICFLKACGGGTSNFDTEISLGAYAIPEIISASSFNVKENKISIGTALATYGNNLSAISYSISGADANSISINSSTGAMIFNTAPDYETKNSYSVKLNATVGSLTGSQDITISISNVSEPIVWQLTDPELVGMSSTKLSDAFDKVLADGSYTQGALVIKDSKLVYERYRGIAVNEELVLQNKNWEGYSTNIQGRLGARDENSLVTSWSTAKSFTSIITAIAIEQGYINSLGQSASDFISEWANDSRKQITIRDLLDMHSGLTMACASNSSGEWILVSNCDTWRRDNGILYFDDMLDGCINREMAQTGVDYPWFNDYGSGELWKSGDYVYMNCDTMVVGEILFRATGKNIETYADLNLFSKIGMDAEWWQDIDGNYLTHCCI
ncbi:MAG: serine hydrolase, partial [Woeseiaceae bacterium]|nr:serine hydrolase [Woeseiaceae bacterium]